MSTNTKSTFRYPEDFKSKVVAFIDKEMAKGASRGAAITKAVQKFHLPNREGARQWWLKAHGATDRTSTGALKVPANLKLRTNGKAILDVKPKQQVVTPSPFADLTPLTALVDEWTALNNDIAKAEADIAAMKRRREGLKAKVTAQMEAV